MKQRNINENTYDDLKEKAKELETLKGILLEYSMFSNSERKVEDSLCFGVGMDREIAMMFKYLDRRFYDALDVKNKRQNKDE